MKPRWRIVLRFLWRTVPATAAVTLIVVDAYYHARHEWPS